MSAARAWIGQALDAHGEGLADGRIRVPRSQAALAEEAGCSAGTIAYYLRVLGDAVSASRRDGLLVDPRLLCDGGDELARRRRRAAEVAEVLISTWGHATDTAGRAELADDDGRPPTVRQMAAALGLNPSTTQRHLDSLSREGRLVRHGRRLYLQAEAQPQSVRPVDGEERITGVSRGGPAPLDPQLLALLADTASALVRAAGDLAAVGRGVLDLVTRAAANPVGADASSPRTMRAPFAEYRDCASDVADVDPFEGSKEVDRSFLPTSELPRPSARNRDPVAGLAEPPGSSPAAPARITARSGAEDVARALLPLQRACERLSLPSVVDEKGRRWLSMFSAEELERGVTQILRQLQSGARLGAPMGLLVAKAKAGDDAFFAAPSPGPSARPTLTEEDGPADVVDPAAAATIATMSPAELGHLDEAVRARLRAVFGARNRSIDGVIGNEQGLAHWRATVWREQLLPAEGVV